MPKLSQRCSGPLLVVLVSLLLPSAAHAQAAITGVVRDASGGVLPGVAVEAASPALIEKVRSVVTDATGRYRIVDLRPGTYTVTMSLPCTTAPVPAVMSMYLRPSGYVTTGRPAPALKSSVPGDGLTWTPGLSLATGPEVAYGSA